MSRFAGCVAVLLLLLKGGEAFIFCGHTRRRFPSLYARTLRERLSSCGLERVSLPQETAITETGERPRKGRGKQGGRRRNEERVLESKTNPLDGEPGSVPSKARKRFLHAGKQYETDAHRFRSLFFSRLQKTLQSPEDPFNRDAKKDRVLTIILDILDLSHGDIPESCRDTDEEGEEMDEDATFGTAPLTLRDYTTLIQAAGKVGAWEVAQDVKDEMEVEGVDPDAFVYTALITAAARVKNTGKAFSLLKEMEAKGLEPNEHTFNALMNACSDKKDVASVKKLMKQKSIQGSVWTEVGAINACARTGNVEKAVEILQELEERMGRSRETGRGEGGDSDLSKSLLVAYNSVLCVCQRAGRWQDAIYVFEKLRRRKDVEPDAVSFCSMLGACERGGNPREVRELFQWIRKEKPEICDTVSYTIAMRAALQENDSETVVELFEEAEEKGVKIDGPLANCVFRALQKLKRVATALDLVESLEDGDALPHLDPDVRSFIGGIISEANKQQMTVVLSKEAKEAVNAEKKKWKAGGQKNSMRREDMSEEQRALEEIKEMTEVDTEISEEFSKRYARGLELQRKKKETEIMRRQLEESRKE